MYKTVILASASPRRRELLSVIFPDFEVIPSNVEEIIPNSIELLKAPEYLSKTKALDIAKAHPDALVIGADTSVIINNKILGKPQSKEEAYNMIKMLSGKEHFVITGCTIAKGEATVSFSEKTSVYFNSLSEQEIIDYINTDEPYDKAGGYGIQGKGALLVKKIEGDYFNVVGLPISKLNITIKEMLNNNDYKNLDIFNIK